MYKEYKANRDGTHCIIIFKSYTFSLKAKQFLRHWYFASNNMEDNEILIKPF